jgi:hypothetical protein
VIASGARQIQIKITFKEGTIKALERIAVSPVISMAFAVSALGSMRSMYACHIMNALPSG